ncbi:MAG: hypothetical protein ACLFWD_00695 [Anaerolineales bacterium]
MENTYTYIARSASDPSRVTTLTLHGRWMSVGTGPALEQVERAALPEGEAEERPLRTRLWLRPMALSLLQRGTGPFPVSDVFASSDGGKLTLKAWFRAGGLRTFPVTLVEGEVDNAEAAQAFVEELKGRKAEDEPTFGFLELLEYWATWILGIGAIVGALAIWRRRQS